MHSVCVDLQHSVGAPLAPLPFMQALASQVGPGLYPSTTALGTLSMMLAC